MMFKNSARLLTANFYNFWKILIYKLLMVGIVIGLCFSLSNLLASSFQEVAPAFSNMMNSLTTANVFLTYEKFYFILQTLVNGYIALATNSVLGFVLLNFFVFILLPFLLKWADIAFSECLSGSMSSLAQQSFMRNFVKHLGLSTIHSLLKTAVCMPLSIGIFIVYYKTLGLVQMGGNWLVFAPILSAISLIILVSLMQTTISGWVPACIIFGTGCIKSFARGLVIVGRRFFRTLSTFIAVNVLFVLLYSFLTLFSLPVLIPLYALFVIILQMVMAFGSQGMRYYVDLDTIVSPQKLEVQDKLSKAKYLI